jgi:hypothetical protein
LGFLERIVTENPNSGKKYKLLTKAKSQLISSNTSTPAQIGLKINPRSKNYYYNYYYIVLALLFGKGKQKTCC